MKNILLILCGIIILLLIFITACDETVSPNDELLIEKTLQPSATDQIISYNNEISIIIPGVALNLETKFTINKTNNLPTLPLEKMTLGNNGFKIIINGQQSYSTPLIISINYDESHIPNGQTINETVKGLLYKNNNWIIADYTLDTINKKILISISNFKTNVSNKENPYPQGDNDSEIIIISGYSQTDTGNSDAPIFKTKQFYINNLMPVLRDYTIYESESVIKSHVLDTFGIDVLSSLISQGKITWEGNSFNFHYTYIKNGYNNQCDIYCKLSNDGKTIEQFHYKHQFYDTTFVYSDLESESSLEFNLINIKYLEYVGGAYWFDLEDNFNTNIIKFDGQRIDYNYANKNRYIEKYSLYSKLNDYSKIENSSSKFTIYFY